MQQCVVMVKDLEKEAFENIVGKGDNVVSLTAFSVFLNVFYHPQHKFQFLCNVHLFSCLQILSIWCGLKFCLSVKSYHNS